MAFPPFYTERRRAQLAQVFLERFRTEPDFVYSIKNIDGFSQKLFERRFNGSSAPTLLQEIDILCAKELKRIPSTLGNGGMVIARSLAEIGQSKCTNGRRKPRPAAVPAPAREPVQVVKYRPPGARPPAATTPLAAVMPELGGGPPPSGNGHDSHHRGRIFWTSTELDTLHAQILEEWQNKPAEGLTHQLVTRAVHKSLPADRWRTINTLLACPELVERATKGIEEMVLKVLVGPAPPEVQIREITVPVDIPTVLAKASWEDLAAEVARREVRAKLRAYGERAAPVEPPPAPKSLPEQGVFSAAQIEGLLPRVQVIGFRGHQHNEMVARFKNHPVIIFNSIDPAAPVDASKLVKGAFYLVDQSTATQQWREQVLVTAGPDVTKRISLSGPSRILDHIKDIAGGWAAKHPQELREWKALQAARIS